MNNKQVAHLWANQSRSSARGSHFYFEGDTIYSYGSHFPIARHYKGIVLFTTRSYSVTTTQHKSIVSRACSHLQKFYVASVLRDPGKVDLKDYTEQINDLALEASRSRNRVAEKLSRLENAVNEANNFAEYFKFKTRFSMPDADTLAAIKERAIECEKREAKRKEKAASERARKEQEQLDDWLGFHLDLVPGRVYLRLHLGQMQTSLGALVPIDEAQRAFRFVTLMRQKGWHRNGEQFKVGDFQLDAVNDQGVVAGCHRLVWDEIDRFAKQMNWI